MFTNGFIDDAKVEFIDDKLTEFIMLGDDNKLKGCIMIVSMMSFTNVSGMEACRGTSRWNGAMGELIINCAEFT